LRFCAVVAEFVERETLVRIRVVSGDLLKYCTVTLTTTTNDDDNTNNNTE